LGHGEQGLILCPDQDAMPVEMYVDADFAGMHRYDEDPQNPESACSQTRYMITMAKCPVLWVSRMQTDETVLSTMMAENITLLARMRELIILKRLVEEVCTHMGLEDGMIATIKATAVAHVERNLFIRSYHCSSGALLLIRLLLLLSTGSDASIFTAWKICLSITIIRQADAWIKHLSSSEPWR
jgi:hypothetical protein